MFYYSCFQRFVFASERQDCTICGNHTLSFSGSWFLWLVMVVFMPRNFMLKHFELVKCSFCWSFCSILLIFLYGIKGCFLSKIYCAHILPSQRHPDEDEPRQMQVFTAGSQCIARHRATTMI